MKKTAIFIFIFIFIFSFSCTFNLFEGDVEANYKSITDPAEKIEYSRQILAGGDNEKISVIIELLKADIEATSSIFEGANLIAAKEIVGNLLITKSGFNDIVANIISEAASTSTDPNAPAPEFSTIILDADNDGTIEDTDIESFQQVIQNLAEAADYLNDAAQDDPDNLDLQFQNIIANMASAFVTFSDNLPEDDPNTTQNETDAQVEALVSYLNGTNPTQPTSYSTIELSIYNITDSIVNLQTYASTGSFYDQLASMLAKFFAGVLS